ncbi:hypothetical protein E4U43_003209 [Claviceps pusilla]|uniref:Quinate repressor protein n=1 Tax=Claviceps pusilla TaxID=123648 RepID=A0A9P7NFK8_9HYPO|nr:hypothetical protein E4U43_003209 [Claviceps pusilla]
MPRFNVNASIVMLGVRAAGKTTLAIMAASALKKKIIDMEAAFQRATGFSSPAYSTIHGTAHCQARQGEVLDGILRNNPLDCIIVCSWVQRHVQGLLRQWATTNPVVHVMRSQDALRDCLEISSEAKLQSFWNTSNAFFRTCCNLEFFNVSEPEQTTNGPSTSEGLPPYLALKQAERHLLKFLSQIYPAGTIPFIESAFPLASVAVEQRNYTYALCVPLKYILQRRIDIEDGSAGADAFQILIDSPDVKRDDQAQLEGCFSIANRITEAVGLVRRSSALPIIIHILFPDSVFATSTYFPVDLLSHALTLAPDMVAVDLKLNETVIAKLSALKKGSKLIGHYCPSTKTSSSWDLAECMTQYQRAVRLGCDLVRFTRPASSVEDSFEPGRLRAALKALPGPHVPVAAYCSGPLGRHSEFLNPVLTPVSPRPDPAGSSQPGPCLHLAAQEATRALYSSFLFDSMKLYLFGASVAHSLSPAMHNAALKICGIPHEYEPLSINSLNQIKHLVQDSHFGGASIGLPFKVEFITLVDSLSRHARAIGAINTLIPIRSLNEDGSVPTGAIFFRNVNRAGPVKALYGDNTDWIGIRACIRRGLSPANAVRRTTCALIIGAGGMARAAVYALLQVGVCNIAIYNRTLDNALMLAEHYRSLLRKAEFQGLAGNKKTFEVLTELSETWPSQFRLPSIVISCIVPSTEFELPISWLANKTGGVILEFGHQSLSTPLLRQAMESANRGWIAMDGLDFLPDQGFAQFELFTGRWAPRGVMRRAVLENYSDQYGRLSTEEIRRRLQTRTD